MMYWYGDHMGGWGYGLGIISMVLFWGLLIVAVVALFRWLGRGREQASPPGAPMGGNQPSSAEQMLSERFAKGEIDAEEYHNRLNILREGARPRAGT